MSVVRTTARHTSAPLIRSVVSKCVDRFLATAPVDVAVGYSVILQYH
jgi:hypothetical protein